jgi:hypothetical protein
MRDFRDRLQRQRLAATPDAMIQLDAAEANLTIRIDSLDEFIAAIN